MLDSICIVPMARQAFTPRRQANANHQLAIISVDMHVAEHSEFPNGQICLVAGMRHFATRYKFVVVAGSCLGVVIATRIVSKRFS